MAMKNDDISNRNEHVRVINSLLTFRRALDNDIITISVQNKGVITGKIRDNEKIPTSNQSLLFRLFLIDINSKPYEIDIDLIEQVFETPKETIEEFKQRGF
ncbi:hypothetical protein MKU65_02360 [Leptospira interrogans]|uniref:hypothetical protein n=2 Tax=Leptospira interrogans TaxID=173 RepID=UPI00046C78FE|nr:hypothetical protein [Leptospira interrogans]ALN99219.1 hypothetical protein LIH_02465 [Leptospira interrogans serovar Hardjo-prajitno]MCH1891416.1 hypothetical protein [Leptospira interrogans]MCH1901593.1 hypothetical protein [Leptospira interrogans]OOB94518.1 hypothetical protein B0191_12330 [Leptospira interrogans serovar Hardjo]UQX07477.1 hypothetical protein MY415_02405 [Leptospira interrogans]